MVRVHHSGASAEGLSEASEGVEGCEAEGGEEAMTDRILEWLRFEHDDPELRTERVIAAMLEMDRDDVRSGLSVLEREGKVVCRWIDGKESWFARTKRSL